MIVVLGRPALDGQGRLGRLAGRIAAAAAANAAGVELVGAVADDAAGDEAIVELGRAGIGHAAVLRTPDGERGLDAGDIELGLRYVTECHVLVVADPLDAAALAAAVEGARYHSAHLVIAAPLQGRASSIPLPVDATVLDAPLTDEGPFAELVGRYAARLDKGASASDAWRDAVEATGWEQLRDDEPEDA